MNILNEKLYFAAKLDIFIPNWAKTLNTFILEFLEGFFKNFTWCEGNMSKEKYIFVILFF